jgi:hypothetical protein
VVTCDNKFILFVNGKEVASGKDYTRPQLVDLKPHLKKGTKYFRDKGGQQFFPTTNHRRGQAHSRIRRQSCRSLPLDAIERQWNCAQLPNGQLLGLVAPTNGGWEKASFDDHDWQPAHELGDAKAGPWKAELALAGAFATSTVRGHVRSALVAADPLMVSLGRPSREQVITCRSSAATTLQALELTNGETLAKVLQQGAAKLIANHPLPKNL